MVWMRRGAGLLLLGTMIAGAQTAKEAPAIAMPADRAADSYAIYSALIPVGELGDPNWPHGLWLVADTTMAMVADDKSCKPEAPQSGMARPTAQFGVNPHFSVTPSEGYEQDFVEILEDFDRHCHERVTLTNGSQWKTQVSLRVLNDTEQNEFWALRGGREQHPKDAKKYLGAPGIFSFSEVYFNKRHTVALVYAWGGCGNLCGQGGWVGLTIVNGKWRALNWKAPVVMA